MAYRVEHESQEPVALVMGEPHLQDKAPLGPHAQQLFHGRPDRLATLRLW